MGTLEKIVLTVALTMVMLIAYAIISMTWLPYPSPSTPKIVINIVDEEMLKEEVRKLQEQIDELKKAYPHG